jgi:RNA polymerase sigma-54 factor
MKMQMQATQQLQLSQRMMQSASILQMNTMELKSYLEELALENPIIDLEEHEPSSDQLADIQKKLEWLEQINETNRIYYHRDQEEELETDFLNSIGANNEITLEEYLTSQLLCVSLSPQEYEQIIYIIQCLDTKGYLKIPEIEIEKKLNISNSHYLKLLTIVQSLDPAGVGARDLKECLLLQLNHLSTDTRIAHAIISSHLELLGKNQLLKIAKALQVTLDEVLEAFALIQSLNPKPGNSFSNRQNLAYLVPDITVVKLPEYFEILINEYMYPQISINAQYLHMLKQNPDMETKKYLSSKLKQAEWVKTCISQRNSTLLNVTKTIIDMQEDFFACGGRLRPMLLSDIALILSLHESTVSRAIRDKYLQCVRGVYPLGFFFSKGIECKSGEETVTPEYIQGLIVEIIKNEDKRKPLSDQKITGILKERGIAISRRTVAKYRTACGLKDASGRKTFC